MGWQLCLGNKDESNVSWLQWQEGKKFVSYFRQKYSQLVCDTIAMDNKHPFLTELKQAFENHVVSQDKAKEALSQALLDSILRLWDPKGPLWVFFFHGPTWVGKTEIVKALAETMFGDAWAFIKINCENFSDRYTGSNLFGSPKWYIWYDEETPFTNKKITSAFDIAKKTWKLNPMIQRMPWFNILLFDEIEKAHPEVIQQLLWLLDEWKIQTSKWEVVNFQNSIIILTSNIWQDEISREKNKNNIWFSSDKANIQDLEKIFQDSLKKIFKPEFIWRIHSFIEFVELSKEDCRKIIDIQVQKFNEYLIKYYSESHIQFELSPELYEYIIQKWYSREKWARELVRTYDNLVKRYLTRLLHSSSFKKYFDYEGQIMIGIDTDTLWNLSFDIIYNGDKVYDVEAIETQWEDVEISLEQLRAIYATVSAYTELSYLSIGDNIDMRDELKFYATKLKQYGLSQNDISSLKERAFLEWLRDLTFIQDFEGIGLWDQEIELFFPYEPRTILKIVERKIQNIYQNNQGVKRKFIQKSIKAVMESIEKLMKVEDLSWEQSNQVLLYIKKTLLEKYSIHYTD